MMTIMHKEIEKCEGALTPYVTIILKEVKKDVAQDKCIFAGNGKYQVTGPSMDQFVVNIREKLALVGYEI